MAAEIWADGFQEADDIDALFAPQAFNFKSGPVVICNFFQDDSCSMKPTADANMK